MFSELKELHTRKYELLQCLIGSHDVWLHAKREGEKEREIEREIERERERET